MRKKMVVGNWKMNTTVEEGKELLTELMNQEISSEAQIVICPPFVHLSALSALVEPLGYISIGAQNCSKFEEGAYTGEVSALMLKEYVEFIIVGHSERRVVFNESNEDIKEKIQMILSHHIKPIFCCGESISIRNEGKHIDFVLNQIKESLFFLDKIDFEKVAIAYEPIWAIGTGLTAGPKEAQEMHAAIRAAIANKYDKDTAESFTILYGGSCNASNAKELFEQIDIDGGLIGGASLKMADFTQIIQSFL